MADVRPEDGSPAGGMQGRRQFFEWLSRAFLGIWALGGATALAAYLKPPARESAAENVVSAGMLDDYRLGEARLIRHGVQPFYVIRTDATRVIALSAVCTHVRCILNYDHQRRGLVCPCHDGRFDLSGNVVSGPPPHPLTSYDVSLRAGEIFVRV